MYYTRTGWLIKQSAMIIDYDASAYYKVIETDIKHTRTVDIERKIISLNNKRTS